MAQTTHFASFVPVLVVVCLPPLLRRLFGPSEVVVDAFGKCWHIVVRRGPVFVVTAHSNLPRAYKEQIEPN